jgi:hypothetical protein
MGTFRLLLLGILMGVSFRAVAQESSEVRKTAILTAVSETAVSEISVIKDRLGSDAIAYVTVSSDVSDRDFLLRLDGKTNSGQEISAWTTGTIWGDLTGNLGITFGGFGHVGKEDPLRLSGQFTWLYDAEKKDYLSADFHLATKIGDHSFWGWVLGAEVVAGGVIGGGGAVATATIATSGAGVGLLAWVAAAGAGAGASALVSASDAARSLLEAKEPPPPPAAPGRAAMPVGEIALAGEGRTYTAVSRDGSLFASSNGQVILSGSFSKDTGIIKGGISVSEKAK